MSLFVFHANSLSPLLPEYGSPCLAEFELPLHALLLVLCLHLHHLGQLLLIETDLFALSFILLFIGHLVDFVVVLNVCFHLGYVFLAVLLGLDKHLPQVFSLPLHSPMKNRLGPVPLL
jgi:hypothetical protein